MSNPRAESTNKVSQDLNTGASAIASSTAAAKRVRPAVTPQQTEYDNALAHHRRCLQRYQDALGNLNNFSKSFPDFEAIRDALSHGRWPEQQLGVPLDQVGPVEQWQGFSSFVQAGKKVYDAYRALRAAGARTTKARKALRKLMKKTSACNAPCKSSKLEGHPCHHMLTAKRICPNHGQRPPLKTTAYA